MSGRHSAILGAAVLAMALLGATATHAAKADEITSCIACHSNEDYFDEQTLAIPHDWQQGVHAEVGISCHDCHGGNPAPELADDMDAAKDETLEVNPFQWAPAPAEIPGFCGRCHSDPVVMRRYRPDARVDQEREYWTSGHGIALAAGNEKVATCVGCHGVHGVQRVDNTEAAVYPTQVAETCRHCHEDAERMTRPGHPEPDVDQYARWRRSVHARALFEKEDLSAPTCNDCHGNHGAAPPGLASIGYVCGQCHGREAGLFRASPKHDGFEAHNEYLADAGEERCTACHDETEPAGAVRDIERFGECTSCHLNHGIVRPSMAMFGNLPEYPCAFCHEDPTAPVGGENGGSEARYAARRDELVAAAKSEGYEGIALFDHLVDVMRELPEHTTSVETEEGITVSLRSEYSRLYDAFRMGKTYFTYEDPKTGEPVRAEVVRCVKCHAETEADEAPGARTGYALLDHMRRLTVRVGHAERVLLAAKRGGVETRDGFLDLDRAIDAQIGLEVLVHTFSTEEGGEFLATFETGLGHVDEALAKGLEAREELAFRRQGLGVALLIIVAVLFGLGAKIRQLAARPENL